MEWTPRGWMKTEPDLLISEQHLYLRQPGYGTSYVTGKYLLERTLADWAKQREERGEPFSLRASFDALNATDSISIALSRCSSARTLRRPRARAWHVRMALIRFQLHPQ